MFDISINWLYACCAAIRGFHQFLRGVLKFCTTLKAQVSTTIIKWTLLISLLIILIVKSSSLETFIKLAILIPYSAVWYHVLCLKITIWCYHLILMPPIKLKIHQNLVIVIQLQSKLFWIKAYYVTNDILLFNTNKP